MMRRWESPVITVLLGGCFAMVVGAVCFVEGAKVRTCPPKLNDGRLLTRIDLRNNECGYQPLAPRGIDFYPPVELRRIATMRERLERVK